MSSFLAYWIEKGGGARSLSHFAWTKGACFCGARISALLFRQHTHTSVAGKFTSRNLSLYLGPDPGVPPFFFSRHPYNPLPPFFLFFLRANERQKYILLHPRWYRGRNRTNYRLRWFRIDFLLSCNLLYKNKIIYFWKLSNFFKKFLEKINLETHFSNKKYSIVYTFRIIWSQN